MIRQVIYYAISILKSLSVQGAIVKSSDRFMSYLLKQNWQSKQLGYLTEILCRHDLLTVLPSVEAVSQVGVRGGGGGRCSNLPSYPSWINLGRLKLKQRHLVLNRFKDKYNKTF